MQRRHALLQHLDLLVQRRRGQVAVAAVIVRPRVRRGEVREVGVSFRLGLLLAARRRRRARARRRRPRRRRALVPRALRARLSASSNSGCAASTGGGGFARSGSRRRRRFIGATRLGAFRGRLAFSSAPAPLRSATSPSALVTDADAISLVSLAFATSALACSMPRSMRSYRSMCPPTSFTELEQRHCHSTSPGTASTRDPAPAPWPARLVPGLLVDLASLRGPVLLGEVPGGALPRHRGLIPGAALGIRCAGRPRV